MPADADLGHGSPTRRPYQQLWRVRHYVRPHLAVMAGMVAAAAAATGAGIVVPLVVLRVVDGPVRHGEPGGLVVLGLLAALFGVIEALLTFIRRWTLARVAVQMEYRMRADLYAHLQRLPVAFHDRWQSGQLLSRVTTDLSVIRRFLSFSMIFLVINLGTYLVVVALLLRLFWPLGIVVAASAVPLYLTMRPFVAGYHLAARRQQDQQGDVATLVEESTHGARTIKSFGRQRHTAVRFAASAGKLRDTGVDKARMIAVGSSRFDVVPNVTLAVVLVAGAWAVSTARMTVGELVAFISLQLMLVWPIGTLSWIIASGQEAMTAADRIYEVFDTKPSIVDRADARVLARSTVRGHLRFEGVGFGYPDTSRPVLRHIDLDVRPGETMALVGTTGSGKSTLVSLVPRLYDVTAGRITLDGHDIRSIRLSSLRSCVAMAFEEPTLFSMSVRENLMLGRPDATDHEVREALAVAAAEFVDELPWGLDTRVGEQGLSLSGGQRQRLALARAVLHRPAVLVLDDPLSALDVHTEALVEKALARVLAGTTALVVVHRPSTVALADRVAFLHDGAIVAVGKHSELLATVPDYRAALSASAVVAG